MGERCRSSSVSYLSCATYCYILILDYPTRHALDFRWHSVCGCRHDWCSGIDDLFQMGLEKNRWQDQAGSMTRSAQQEGRPTQKQRRGDPGVEPQQKGPHVDWHFWANQVAALWTFSQLKRNSARFGARRRSVPEGLLHATECCAPSANRHYYSLEMTGLETNSCRFQRAPRLLPQSI